MTPDPQRIHTFETAAAFERWLAAHHDSEPEVWIKVHKKSSGLPSVTVVEALDIVLCWGWIDGLRKSFDEDSFLQRYSPRGKRSRWSQINRRHVERLIEAGRMKPAGQRQIDAAKADGRWGAAYAPMRETTTRSLPADLRRAIAANPRAKRAFATLDKQNLFSLAFRTNAMKTPEGRARKITELVGKLASGQRINSPAPRKKRATRKRR